MARSLPRSIGAFVWLLVHLCFVAAVKPPKSLTPLTAIAPNREELSVFTSTLRAALARLGAPSGSKGTVVHVVGATSVEDDVDWAGKHPPFNPPQGQQTQRRHEI